jgi:hypothetical protein
VQVRSLAQVADELYGLPPSAFIPARDERAGQARAAGDRDLAGSIRKLRRPTVSAWLVNLLARDVPGQVGELLELGESLREAQQALAGDRLRELSTQRRRLVTGLVQEARRLAGQAGQPFGAQAEREVQDTLEAALADPAVAEAVRSGRLTTALSYAGLGSSVDVHGAVAVWPEPAEPPAQTRRRAAPAGDHERAARRPAAPKRHARETGTAQRDRREAEAAERARREAEAAEHARREAEAAERNRQEAAGDVREAQASLDEAEREVTSAREKHEARQRRIDELERQLGQMQAESGEGLRALRHAQRNRDVAARALDGALRRLARAEAKAGPPR